MDTRLFANILRKSCCVIDRGATWRPGEFLSAFDYLEASFPSTHKIMRCAAIFDAETRNGEVEES
jgi:hypothetical protein